MSISMSPTSPMYAFPYLRLKSNSPLTFLVFKVASCCFTVRLPTKSFNISMPLYLFETASNSRAGTYSLYLISIFFIPLIFVPSENLILV